jgi:lipopolysaccharide heptosyltransferase II
MKWKEKRPPRIWVVGVDWLGDVIFSTPLLRAIKKRYPKCYLAYSAPTRCAEILEGNPYVDEIIPYEESVFLKDIFKNTIFVQKLRKSKFDIALFLHRSVTRAFLAWCAGIPQRTGFSTLKRHWILTERLSAPGPQTHRTLRYLRTLGSLEIPPDGSHVEVHVTADGRREWERLKHESPLGEQAHFAVLHPGGNWALKRWPLERFAQTVRVLEKRGIWTVICGQAKEAALSKKLMQLANSSKTVSFCGKTSLKALVAMIGESRFVISNDSGPLHIAAGLSRPLIGLFGPTVPQQTGPLSKGPVTVLQNKVGCELPCYFSTCHHHSCMESLSPESVNSAVDQYVSRYGY